MADLSSAYTSIGEGPICSIPLGDRTTVIDIADRNEMDDEIFPLSSEKSFFVRDQNRRILPFSPVLQEFAHIGTAEFGGRLVFEIGSVKACDLLFSVALQIKLNSWWSSTDQARIQAGLYEFLDPNSAWLYANSLGTVLIEYAEFMLEDQTLERIDGDFTNIFSFLYPDVNSQFGVGTDAYGYSEPGTDTATDINRIFPTSNGIITCLLPFSFQRIRRREGFPLLSVKEGTVRVAIQLRPFHEVVRMLARNRVGCEETPLNKSFPILDTSVTPAVIRNLESTKLTPLFADVRLLTYGVFVDGMYRNALLRAPFDRLYRELQTFRFAEPLKYLTATPIDGQIRVQLPLELNHPIEEIIWIVRRKAVSINNEWTNYSATLQLEEHPVYNPKRGLLMHGAIQINGETLVEGSADFFRQQIAEAHKGGIVAYEKYIYGYSFARNPGAHDPSGTINTSRSTDIRLRLDILPPDETTTQFSTEWEVIVYAIALNWVRFQNGIANRVFSS